MKPDLSPAQIQRSMRLSVIEGMLYALMVGFGETYFLADVLRLGGSPLQQGLMVAMPLFVGSLGPLVALRLLSRMRSRRPLVVAAVLGQSATLLAVALADLRGWSGPVSLIASACLYQVFGQSAGAGWSSWYGDLVPEEVRGRYFSLRTRAVHGLTCGGLFAAGFLLQTLEPEGGVAAAARGGKGFAVIFAIAALARLVSAALLFSSPERRFQGVTGGRQVKKFLRTDRGARAWRLLAAVAALQFAVYFGSPYFGVYMLKDLGFRYIDYSLATLTIVTVKVLTLPSWGRQIDSRGARRVCSLAVVLLALVPVPWLWARGLGWVLVAQAFSGMSWAAFEVSWFALLLESSFKRTRVFVFAAQSVLNGTAQLLGTLSAALVVTLWHVDLRVLFATSAALRLTMAVLVILALRHLPLPSGMSVRHLLLRVVGMRPSGGLVHRPMPTDLEPDEAAVPRR